ncbi:hypothetical protein [Anaeromyxobacter dehalogenans]|nr:hypothetical protein [Anaeromyxobacter dehalogenans]
MIANARPVFAAAETHASRPVLAQLVRKLARWADHARHYDLTWTPCDPKIVDLTGGIRPPVNTAPAGLTEVVIGTFIVPPAQAPLAALAIRVYATVTLPATGAVVRLRSGSGNVTDLEFNADSVPGGTGWVSGSLPIGMPEFDTVTVSLIPRLGCGITIHSLSGWWDPSTWTSARYADVPSAIQPMSSAAFAPGEPLSPDALSAMTLNCNLLSARAPRPVVNKSYTPWYVAGGINDQVVARYRIWVSPGTAMLTVKTLVKHVGAAATVVAELYTAGETFLALEAQASPSAYGWLTYTLPINHSARLGGFEVELRIRVYQPPGDNGFFLASVSCWEQYPSHVEMGMPAGETYGDAFNPPALPGPIVSRNVIRAQDLLQCWQGILWAYRYRRRQTVCDCLHTGIGPGGWAAPDADYLGPDVYTGPLTPRGDDLAVAGLRMVRRLPTGDGAYDPVTSSRQWAFERMVEFAAITRFQPYAVTNPPQDWRMGTVGFVHWAGVSWFARPEKDAPSVRFESQLVSYPTNLPERYEEQEEMPVRHQLESASTYQGSPIGVLDLGCSFAGRFAR